MAFFRRNKSKQPTSIPTPVGAGGPLSASSNFDVVVRQLAAEITGTEVGELGDDCISTGNGQMYLTNVRANYEKQDPATRESWLRSVLEELTEPATSTRGALDRSKLRPAIRSEMYPQVGLLSIKATGAVPDPKNAIAARPLAEGMVRCLVLDSPTSMRPLCEIDLDECGVDFEELWTVAVANLAGDPSSGGWAKANNTWISLDVDDYAAERIFLDGFIPPPLIGEVVMFHTNRTELILCDADDPVAIAESAEWVLANGLGKPNPVSLNPIVGRGMSWRPLVLADDHPGAAAVRELHMRERTQCYGQQAAMLQEVVGEDLFVANFMVAKDPTSDAMFSAAAWTQGVPTLLPVTDQLAFVTPSNSGEPEVVTVPWEAAQSVVGHRMEPTGYYPQRHRVVSFPDADELAQLRPFDFDAA